MKKNKPDQSFDKIAHKFQKNIYGTTKGQLRQDLLLHHLCQQVPLENEQSLRILDAGGGTGVMTKALLAKGHHVVLNDWSQDTLTLAEQTLGEFSEVEFVAGRIQELSLPAFDLVICHAVLEWLEDPIAAIKHLLGLTRTNGYLSLSFFNRHAQKFGNVLYGNFDYAEQDLPRKRHVRMNPNNALEPQTILDALSKLPVKICQQAGIRCFHDYLRHREQQQTHYQQIKRIEIELGTQSPYRELGKYYHIICQKL